MLNVALSITISLSTAVFQAAEVSKGPFDCDVEHCQHIVNTMMFVIISISFIVPIVLMFFVLITLHHYKARAESIGNFSMDISTIRAGRTRLAWTLFTFTLISLTEAIPSSYLEGLNIDDSITVCSNFYRADHLTLPAIMISFQTLAWSIALITDPLCGILFDPTIRKVMVQHTSRLKIFVLNHYKRCFYWRIKAVGN